MHERTWIRSSSCQSDNRKSKIQNRKWAGIFAIALTFAMCRVVAEAQQPKKVPRIGYLSVSSLSVMADRIEAFRQGLRELGYVEGKDIVIEWRYGEEKPDRVSDLATELVRLKVDVIVSGGNSATQAAKKATNTIPIVMTQASDPVASGFVASLARPGGNVSGL
jgi:putative tryptophan/tyrosine transport system substrate-binding protein